MAGAEVVPVVVETPRHAGLDTALSYGSQCPLTPGTLVRVPLGHRQVAGLVWLQDPGLEAPSTGIREITEVCDALPPLPAPWRELVAFAASYYQRGLGEIALSVLPVELRRLGNAALANRLARLEKRLKADDAADAEAAQAAPELAPAQAEAGARIASAMAAAEPGTVLLHGTTGSGKTEVYLRAAAAALELGRQALVLVPEINLTPQLVARFAGRFTGKRIVALHSGLTPAARLRHWLLAHTGRADIVLGTRLAVFASLPRLGLVVVDEEHDPSYKQQEGARYSARDLAVWRGRNEKVLVVLGSATPSLESWHNAEAGRYQRLGLPGRIGGAAWPVVRLLDMNRLPKARGTPAALAPPLVAAIEDRIARGEQSLVFLNRRGYAPVLHCAECSWKSACPHCSAWRVFHKQDRTLRCHHCGLADAVPRRCPDCGNPDIAPIGRGTERLEEQMAALLPGARIARIDADSTRRKGALEAQLGAVHAGEVDVLVGTQMIAKGHDFRRIGLVAAVNPDSSLFSSDFRAPERLFALLMQAAGRAGRDAAQASPSEMWVQTWHPSHPLYAALCQHDFASFAASQLKERESAGLPPYSHLAVLRAEAKTVAAARGFLVAAAEVAAATAESARVMVYAPVPLGIARVADVERMQMLVESSSRQALQAMLRAWLPRLAALRQERNAPEQRLLRWAVDVDPLAI
ncbi:MAG: primosomal protein N' [Burkholderiales bacterium]|nr:primosomal protein N' [Burkholderiales bacterium]